MDLVITLTSYHSCIYTVHIYYVVVYRNTSTSNMRYVLHSSWSRPPALHLPLPYVHAEDSVYFGERWEDRRPRIKFEPNPETFRRTVTMSDRVGHDEGPCISLFCAMVDTKDKAHKKPQVHTAYKRVDKKVKPVAGTMPEEARVIRQFPEDPLTSLPPLSPIVPDFVPTAKLTAERIHKININPDGYLWPEEEKLFLHILKLNERSIAFQDSDRGTLRSDYFSPYIMPVVPHEAWKESNIPIPPGIKDKVIKILKERMAAGAYEPSQSSYRSRWFCVLKKSGDLRIVHDLQPLNRVSKDPS